MAVINYDKALLGKLKSNYFNAKALYEITKETAEEIQRKILTENEFFTSEDLLEPGEEKERILDPYDSYMMFGDQYLKYVDLCYAEYVKAGIDDPRGKEYIPEAEERELYHKAKRCLVNYALDIMPDGYIEKDFLKRCSLNLKWESRILDIVLSLESDPIVNYATGERMDK